jgi:hypothetical protein
MHIRQAEEEKAKQKTQKKQEQSKLKQNETVYYLVLLLRLTNMHVFS